MIKRIKSRSRRKARLLKGKSNMKSEQAQLNIAVNGQAAQANVDYVAQNNAKLDRVFDRIYRLHGGDLAAFLNSVAGQQNQETEMGDEFLFHGDVVAARR